MPANHAIALFIDLQNTHLFAEALSYAQGLGRVLYARGYGRKDQLSPSKRNQLEASNIDFIDVVCQGGKNSVDIRIVIDALEYAFTKPEVTAVALCADDGDYRHLVTRLLSIGKGVILIHSRAPKPKLYAGLQVTMKTIAPAGRRGEGSGSERCLAEGLRP